MEGQVIAEGLNSGEFAGWQVEARSEPAAQAASGDMEEVEHLPALAKDAAQRGGMVETNCRCGTGWQTLWAIQSPVRRVHRWWQAGQKWSRRFHCSICCGSLV